MNGHLKLATAIWGRDATLILSVVEDVSESVLLLEMDLLPFSQGPTPTITRPQEATARTRSPLVAALVNSDGGLST